MSRSRRADTTARIGIVILHRRTSIHPPILMTLCRGSLVLVCAGLVLLSGCKTRAEKAEDHDDFLASSGFTAIPANTPERQELLAHLPPHRFATDQRNGKTIFIYPDPLVCKCLYVGRDEAFSKYQESMRLSQVDQSMLADRTQLHRETIDTYRFEVYALQSQYAAWNWGAWGPGWWW